MRSLALGLALFAPIALLGNEAGTMLRYPDIGAAILFPPYAALTAALVATPRRHWIWYILVADAAHFLAHWPHWTLSWVMFADVANVTRALTAAILLQWFFDGRPEIEGIDSLARFVLSTVIVAPAVVATIGATSVVLHGASPTFALAWRAWFMSNALTGLTMMPGFVLLASHGVRWSACGVRRRIVEATALVVAIAATCLVAGMARQASKWELLLVLYARRIRGTPRPRMYSLA
jgi:integral membrane sensor domain MASE1